VTSVTVLNVVNIEVFCDFLYLDITSGTFTCVCSAYTVEFVTSKHWTCEMSYDVSADKVSRDDRVSGV